MIEASMSSKGSDRLSYEGMLEEAYKELSTKAVNVKLATERFKIPQVKVQYQGKSKTLLLNFKEICDYINRDRDIVKKFIAKELGVPAAPSGDRLLLDSHIDVQTLQNTLDYFVKKYVKCPVCGGYDTRLMKKEKYYEIKCDICGAVSPAPPIK